ncbi:MAG: bifunctional UDP-sugar hydrolase/5'-nucleotidase [Anaerolineae bacterium]
MFKRAFIILLLVLAVLPAHAQTDPVTIRIINTSDEHGWLEPYTPPGSQERLGGAAYVAAWWASEPGYDPDRTLILSGGDNWTGPSISTWFQGQPVVEAFNLMGYTATAIGNHEFDFGREVLAERIAESHYTYLGANIRDRATGALADFVKPYILREIDGVTVGIIGLATTETATTTHPANISDLTFAEYAPVLAEYVPQMRAAGADVVILLSHICVDELADLAFEVGDLVDAMFGGHCNAFVAADVNGVPVLGGGWAWRSYARLDLTVDPDSGAILDTDYALVSVTSAENGAISPDPALEALVARWQAQVEDALAEEIGYTASGILRRSPQMLNLVTDAWLAAYPADVALTNLGGFRQDIPSGPITLADIVGMLPFENRLIAVTVTGEELAANLVCCGGAVSGITYTRLGTRVTMQWPDGRPVDPDETLIVLVNDFMYYGGDDYLFGTQDPEGYDTGIQWRQPVIDWLRAHPTTPDQPLEAVLDTTRRNRG